jgi:hypothetical protein
VLPVPLNRAESSEQLLDVVIERQLVVPGRGSRPGCVGERVCVVLRVLEMVHEARKRKEVVIGSSIPQLRYGPDLFARGQPERAG